MAQRKIRPWRKPDERIVSGLSKEELELRDICKKARSREEFWVLIDGHPKMSQRTRVSIERKLDRNGWRTLIARHDWTDEEVEKLLALIEAVQTWQEFREKAPEALSRSWEGIVQKMRRIKSLKDAAAKFPTEERLNSVLSGVMTGDTEVEDAKKKKEVPPPEYKSEKWPEPEVFEISPEAWNAPVAREGNMSRIDYKAQGYRRYLVVREVEQFAADGCHYNNIVGGLVSKLYIQERINQRMSVYGRRFASEAIEHVIREAAEELASVLPIVKKPKNLNGNGNGNGQKESFWARYYIYPSPTFDGPYGDRIARKLQEIRLQERGIDDIRVGKVGGERRLVKGVSKRHGIIVPRKSRLPTRYHSSFAEAEIRARTDRSTQAYPDMYVVGTAASSLYVPDGIHKRPYIMVGASHRLEEETNAPENQVSIAVVHYPSPEERLVRVWSFKDLVARERYAISGIKDGANDLHRKIVELIKEEGNRSIGELADELNVSRATVEQEIKFLLTDESVQRKTWPGLWYDEHAQRYDFHLDWIQERLMVPFPKDGWKEDSALIFACMHAGYNTTDYPFIVNKFPEIILKHNIKRLMLVGDVKAGMHHSFIHTGEVMSALDKDEQSLFAAELMDTVMLKVFRPRMDAALAGKNKKSLTPLAVAILIDDALCELVVIPGNHDLWDEQEGSKPLAHFLLLLERLLTRHVAAYLVEHGLLAVDVSKIVERKIVLYPDFLAIHELPSGLRVDLQHQHLGGAETTSLRIQKTLDGSDCQWVCLANFHRTCVDHKWYPDRGQCVGVQVPCMQALYGTRFERRKGKAKVDFGPVYLRTLSREGRIWMTETGFYNTPTLEQPYKKWTDMDQLKHDLGLVGYE